MKCFKILLLVSLIPLVLRGVSLLGNVVIIPAASSPGQPSTSSSSDNGAASVSSSSSVSSASLVSRGRGHAHLSGGFAGQRRFGGDGFFRDDKRFSPTGSNPLHNL